MTEETQTEEKVLEPSEIISAGETVLEQLYNEIKENPKKYKDIELIPELFKRLQIVYNEGLNVKLQQSAEKYFNLVGSGFTILMRIFMAKHGIVPVLGPQMQVQQTQTQKPLITL